VAGGQSGQPQAVSPTYVMATLPGSDTPEFLLLRVRMVHLVHNGHRKFAHPPRPPVQASTQYDDLRNGRIPQICVNCHCSSHHQLRLPHQVLVAEPRTPFLRERSLTDPFHFRLLICGEQRQCSGITEGRHGSPAMRNSAPHAHNCCSLARDTRFHADQCVSTGAGWPTLFENSVPTQDATCPVRNRLLAAPLPD